MYNKNPALASLLSARICHDLANPLGAISNGMELMELAGATRTPEFDLTADSIQNANAKLNFFRTAFGTSHGSDVSATQIAKVLADVYLNTRCQVEWTIPTPTTRADTKVRQWDNSNGAGHKIKLCKCQLGPSVRASGECEPIAVRGAL